MFSKEDLENDNFKSDNIAIIEKLIISFFQQESPPITIARELAEKLADPAKAICQYLVTRDQQPKTKYRKTRQIVRSL